jgi:hypothetical protein
VEPSTALIVDIGAAGWVAPNPFGEPTAYILVHPIDGVGGDELGTTAQGLGFKRLDAEGDIMWVGTDTLLAALRAMQVEFWSGDSIWVRHAVTDDWTGAAIARRYVVLVIGTAPLTADPDGSAIAAYLSNRESVHAGLVKIRLNVTDG